MSPNPLLSLPTIYDSAVDVENWGETLETSARNLGAKGALILMIEKTTEGAFQVGHFSKIWTRAPERAAMYNQRYAHYERPVWEALSAKPRQSLILSTEFWADEPDIRNRPDYKFLSEAVGICHKCAARLNDNKSWFDSLVIHFDESLGDIPKKSIEGISVILPHVAKPIELGRAFELLKSSYRAVLSALDYVDMGMCIVLGDGTVVVCNEEAARILDMCDGLSLGKNRKFVCRDPHIQSSLTASIETVSETARGQSSESEVLFSIKRPSCRGPLLIELAPLRDYSAEIETNLHGALVTIVDPENTSSVNIDRLSFAYRLSEAESEVCRYLVDGWANTSIAEERGVSVETIKSQVNTIMRKTDTGKRSELIRLALKTSPPVRIKHTSDE